MNPFPLRRPPAPRSSDAPDSISLPAAFSEQLSHLYQLVQSSSYVFGSPLGPIASAGRELHLPRFVYFGPHASDAALRLSFLAGYDHRDLKPTLALLRLVEGLALAPDIGQGLNLSFFPLVDVLGLSSSVNRQLDGSAWNSAGAPEIVLLEKDARARAYHGFVRIESATGDDVVTVSLRAANPQEPGTPSLELISSTDVEPLAVRWEYDSAAHLEHGPLSIADDLPLQPFELTVRIPAAWSLDRYADAAASILKRFVRRYRSFISYAQHL